MLSFRWVLEGSCLARVSALPARLLPGMVSAAAPVGPCAVLAAAVQLAAAVPAAAVALGWSDDVLGLLDAAACDILGGRGGVPVRDGPVPPEHADCGLPWPAVCVAVCVVVEATELLDE